MTRDYSTRNKLFSKICIDSRWQLVRWTTYTKYTDASMLTKNFNGKSNGKFLTSSTLCPLSIIFRVVRVNRYFLVFDWPMKKNNRSIFSIALSVRKFENSWSNDGFRETFRRKRDFIEDFRFLKNGKFRFAFNVQFQIGDATLHSVYYVRKGISLCIRFSFLIEYSVSSETHVSGFRVFRDLGQL